MSLLSKAQADLSTIMTDSRISPTISVTLTDPDGVSGAVSAVVADIGATEDPDTGILIHGRFVTASVALSELDRVGFENYPRGYEDVTEAWEMSYKDLTWLARFADIDHTLGIILITFEAGSDDIAN